MTARGQLLAAAVVGVGQQPPPVLETGSPALDALLARAKENWLDAASLIACHDAAGVLPETTSAVAPEPAQDRRPIAAGLALSHLEIVLRDRRSLLPEWLGLLAKSGRRPAPEWLPSLLDAATADRSLRDGAAQAAGAVGRWLAPFRDEWKWITAAGSVEEALWETGRFDERLAVLRAVRATEPDRARRMVEAVWSTENADARRHFLAVLQTKLSLADEPFLEAALDDRSGPVRAAAADHLASLAGSALVARMRERVAARLMLKKEGFLGRRRVLDVELLEAPDKAGQRDGLGKKPATVSQQLGERGWWTLAALSAVPPSEWCARFSLDPAQMVEAAANGSWQALLMSAWATAAGRHADTAWLEALIPHLPNPLLFAPLAPAARERLATPLLKAPADFLALIPSACPHAWSAAFTEQYLDAVRTALRKNPDDYRLRASLPGAGQHASPEAAFPYDADETPHLAALLDIVAFRRQMRKALLEPHAQ